jgi:uncharacterized protein YciI
MLFALINTDRPASLELRMATRPAHLKWLETEDSKIVTGGALLDPEGKPIGSLIVVDVPDRAAAEAFVQSDPYTKAGLFEGTVVRPFRQVYKDGVKIG